MGWRTAVLDMDGVVYRGERPIQGSPEAIDRMRKAGKTVKFLTNNATRTCEEYSEKLERMGIPTRPSDVLTSGIATAIYIAKTMGKRRVHVVGSPSLAVELTREGLELVESERAEVVVTSLDFQFSYQKLYDAMRAIRRGCPLISTNKDPVVPGEDGFVPGAGSITSAVEVASGVTAINVGKPSTIILSVAERAWDLERSATCIVGDRLDTDVAAGNSFGWRSILVLTGSTGESDLRARLPDSHRPSAIYRDLYDFASAEL